MIHIEPERSHSVTQLTIRGFDRELERRIRNLARSKGISLNQAVLQLLKKGAGLPNLQSESNVIGDSLDDLAGTWTEEEEAEFLKAIEPFERIDEDLWK
jgi:hypothetical protein